eukprot:TRINITY_DN68380_c0_g1_i1.p1 TRINITY_DN68380_c0_g1~~TRINITY_DN68380_c0_g1_i1.p1  ORF type:complete len:583 (+),score=78.10 TRINITY_DN68380_c0_g1_i1:63-1751(+)
MDDAWWTSMTSTDTPNAGRCWWGWGTVAELRKDMLSMPRKKPLSVNEAARSMRLPRVQVSSLPPALQTICTDHPFERLLHSRGRDFVDIVECLSGVPRCPTDLVAFPSSEADISMLLAFCSDKRIAIIPWGGGSSVAFGVNPPADEEGYAASITVDMIRFDRVLEVDEVSMCARVQAGVYGPSLEKQLKERGFTLRHFPQSFEYSTLGGWIVTRGGGHFATGPTHMDELVQSIRLVAPAGTTESRRLPASGAGPAEHRLYIGSEGILGIVTEAWVRIRPVPKIRASATVVFRSETGDQAFIEGAQAVRRIAQTGIQPANLRLVYGAEVARTAHEDGLDTAAVLLIGFEAPDETTDLDFQMRAVLQICKDAGGEVPSASAGGSFVRRGKGGGEREGIAGKWGSGFMRGGYMFTVAAAAGGLLNTFETATTWDRFFGGFHTQVLAAVRRALQEHCGGGVVTCRFTHIYPDGPAPYYTIMAPGNTTPSDQRTEQWLKIKRVAMETVMDNGGTSTHHHSVGKLHRSDYHKELGAMFKGTLESVKRAHDPAWVLNPGVLLEPPASKL